ETTSQLSKAIINVMVSFAGQGNILFFLKSILITRSLFKKILSIIFSSALRLLSKNLFRDQAFTRLYSGIERYGLRLELLFLFMLFAFEENVVVVPNIMAGSII
ncbi:hypothetical protein ACJX0J_017415, partial [Zea mays]